jgi:hypothetical protein
MAQIEIPFSREMAIAIFEGRKIATTRSEKKGEIGDTFDVIVSHKTHGFFIDAGKCRLIDIWPNTWLTTVRDDLYRLEGFDSPEAFERGWRALHRGHFTTNKDYFVHFFARVI